MAHKILATGQSSTGDFWLLVANEIIVNDQPLQSAGFLTSSKEFKADKFPIGKELHKDFIPYIQVPKKKG